jgi:hypothetical protein
MQKSLGIIALVLACTAAVAAQSPLAGKWQGETPGGSSLALELVVKDTALTGTLTREDEKSAITDGKVTKDTFTFKATIGGQTEGFAGELKGEELRIWLERQGPAKAVTMTRVKSAPSKTPGAGR